MRFVIGVRVSKGKVQMTRVTLAILRGKRELALSSKVWIDSCHDTTMMTVLFKVLSF